MQGPVDVQLLPREITEGNVVGDRQAGPRHCRIQHINRGVPGKI